MEQCTDSYKEIIEFAIGHEIKAYQLYIDISKRMVNQKTKKLCEKLAKEEIKHKARLAKESSKKCQFITPVNLSKYDIAHSKINIFANVLSMLAFAIKKENAAVELYRELAWTVKNENSRKMFTWLAEEESKHLKQVEHQYSNCLK